MRVSGAGFYAHGYRRQIDQCCPSDALWQSRVAQQIQKYEGAADGDARLKFVDSLEFESCCPNEPSRYNHPSEPPHGTSRTSGSSKLQPCLAAAAAKAPGCSSCTSLRITHQPPGARPYLCSTNAVDALKPRAHLCTKNTERAACSLLQHSGATDETRDKK